MWFSYELGGREHFLGPWRWPVPVHRPVCRPGLPGSYPPGSFPHLSDGVHQPLGAPLAFSLLRALTQSPARSNIDQSWSKNSHWLVTIANGLSPLGQTHAP